MGLLDLLLQNQSNLDINPVPPQGNGPVGTPTGEFNTGATPFQQVWNSNNTYLNTFVGGQNVGIQPPTLKASGLDIDDPNFLPSTTTPNTLTVYPATALGGLGQSAVQFLQIWSPVINYNNVVVGAGTSPLAQSLDETGLDNTDPASVPTTVSPINTTNYPSLATGEYNSAPNQYNQIYNSNNTYLNNFNPNVQPNSLADTGLDIENIGLVATTVSPSTNTSYPNLSAGEFGGQSNNFIQTYTPTNTYLNNITIEDPNSPQIPTLSQTGLDDTDPSAAPTTVTPNTITQYPSLTSGEFGGGAGQYTQTYNANNTYLNSNFTNAQQGTLDLTGLDNVDINALPTTFTPNNISAPTDYSIPSPSPQIQMGEFGGAPSQYQTPYTPTNTYLSQFNSIVNPTTNTQVNTLDETGLDVESTAAAPTTYVVPGIDNITTYPPQATGEYNGPATPFGQTYTPEVTYENTIVNAVGGPVSVIENSTQYTGLDIENQNAAPTTYAVPQTDNITVYPPEVTGELGNAPSQYTQEWEPENKYYNFMKENYQAQ